MAAHKLTAIISIGYLLPIRQFCFEKLNLMQFLT
jgi:hypothetical protein